MVMYEIKEFSVSEFSEPLGTKEKFWIKNKEFLFKIGRENTLENCSEKIAYEIAKLIDLPTAEYDLAIYTNGMQKQGVASTNFLKERYFILANEFLGNRVGYEKEKKYKLKEYTLDVALQLVLVIQRVRKNQKDILQNFVGYLVFDFLIGNQDRHHENWRFIINKNGLTLAPSFDHAAGLASKVSDKEAKERLQTKDKNYSVEAFCKKATTPFYKGDKKLKTFEMIEELYKKEQTKQYASKWIEKIAKVKEEDYQQILDQVPQEFIITQNQKDFIKKMLLTNTKLLQEIRGKYE